MLSPAELQSVLNERTPRATLNEGSWFGNDPFHNPARRYTRTVAITYPRPSYFVYEILESEGWVADNRTDRSQVTKDRAVAQAQTMANQLGKPVRVLEVVDT